MDSVEAGITTIITEISKCAQILSKSLECKNNEVSYTLIKHARYQILTLINKIKQNYCLEEIVSKEGLERNIFLTEMKSHFEETKIRYLRKEWNKQQHTLARLQGRLIKECEELSRHSDYCSSQGSAICYVIAGILRNPNIVEHVIKNEEKYLIGLVKIAEVSLFSYTKKYEYFFPLKDSPDHKFMMAIFKAMLRISNSPKGSEFLITREEGQNLIWTIIHSIPVIKHSVATDLLKDTLWCIIFNIETCDNGSIFLKGCRSLVAALNACIHSCSNSDIYTRGLKILDRITKNIPDKEYFDRIIDLVSLDRLNRLVTSSYHNVDSLPQQILDNLEKASKDFNVEDSNKSMPQPLLCKYSRNCVNIKKSESKIPIREKKAVLKRKKHRYNDDSINTSVSNFTSDSNMNEKLQSLISSPSYKKSVTMDMLFLANSSKSSDYYMVQNDSKSFNHATFSNHAPCKIFYDSPSSILSLTFNANKSSHCSYKIKRRSRQNYMHKLKKEPYIKCSNNNENSEVLLNRSLSFITIEEEFIYADEACSNDIQSCVVPKRENFDDEKGKNKITAEPYKEIVNNLSLV